MPRAARASVGGICYHVINRGNARREVFLKDDDYEAFLKALGHASIEIAMGVLGYRLSVRKPGMPVPPQFARHSKPILLESQPPAAARDLSALGT